MPSLRLIAPAKINLCLRITGRRPDGYHCLEMLNVPLALADEVVVSRSSEGGGPEEIALRCDHPDIPQGDTNLCVRAAMAMREASGRTDPLAIDLTKRIPVGGGLGGGSSDAAAVLSVCNRLWGLQWSDARRAAVGLPLGADIPFFCYGRPAWVGGIGEQVEVVEAFPKLWILLLNPGFGVSTPWAYRQYDLNLTVKDPHVRSRPRFIEGFELVTHLCGNDLEGVVEARYPVIRQMREALYSVGAATAQMSGSGATVFGLFATRAARDGAAEELASADWRVIPTESV